MLLHPGDTAEESLSLADVARQDTEASASQASSQSGPLSSHSHIRERGRSAAPSDQERTREVDGRYTSAAAGLPPKQFLELCVNTGEFRRQLAEIDVTGVRSDTELFCRIKKKYLEIRGFRAKYFLLKPVDIHFVRVCESLPRWLV